MLIQTSSFSTHINETKLLMKGVFAVNKIKNVTSFEVVDILKDILLKGINNKIHPRVLKVGHGGTLDYTATGVLVIGVGDGCKVLSKFLHGSKKYRVTGHLGIATDTYNEGGNITMERSYGHVSKPNLEEALIKFQGNILQIPPAYSALKFHGQRVADLTRIGVHVDLKPRPVTCHSIQCLDFSPPFFTLEVHCGGGFYVRSLIHDLGNVLGTCAHVQELHRFQQGPFTEQEMLDQKDWTVENILLAICKAKEIHGSLVELSRRKFACDIYS